MTNCPRCTDISLVQKVATSSQGSRRRVEVDRCPNCRGVWFDAQELDDLIEDLSKLGELEITCDVGDLHCPRCEECMSRGHYRGTMVEIDLCRVCKGIWLDPGEFKRIRAGADRLIVCCDCGQRYSVPKSKAGKTIDCRNCGQPLSITETGGTADLPTLLDELAAGSSNASQRLRPRRKYKDNTSETSFVGIGYQVFSGFLEFLSRGATLDLSHVRGDRKDARGERPARLPDLSRRTEGMPMVLPAEQVLQLRMGSSR